MLVDTHCHLNDGEAFPNPELAILEAVSAGVSRMIVVGVDAESSRSALEMADRFESVFAIVGWHPNYTSKYTLAGLEEIRSLVDHPKCVAIGEIGLDYHWAHATREQQYGALVDQLDLAADLKKPVVFHCRDAHDDLLDLLEARSLQPFLFHCFAGDAQHAVRAKRLDAYFGVDGPITYKKSSDLREVVRTLPRDRLVVETDSPYLSPEPLRGKPNKPANVVLVNAALASTLGMTPVECGLLTTANAERFFGAQISNSMPS